MSQKFKSEVELQALNNATTDTDKFLVSDSGVVKYRTGNEVLSDLGITLNTASKLQHQVKAGVAINKGQAVYVTSADGTNMIVGLASNASEATSSKTMGLLDATVAINGFANVVTEGLLAGLNTVGANAGDPVWLGTSGNLIYGLLNKPYAPAHLVFIGIVTRVNANNGEIFVKVQNGFELNEIHDVDLKTTTPINGHILGFDGTLWVNKTIAGWLGYTPWHPGNDGSGSGLDADLLDGYHASAFQLALTNPVTGTGTTNYVSKFTSGTTLGNSQIFDNGTNVGIGTTSPSSKLDVTDTSAGNIVNNITVQNASNTAGTEAGVFFAPTTATGNIRGARITGIQEDGNNTIGLKFYTGSGAPPTEKMRITSGGNVGIGTSSPGGKLHVVGEGIFDDGTNGRLTFGNGSSQNDIYSTTTAFGDWKDLRYTANNHIFRYAGLEVMRITNGNVGIGTTSPSEKLHISGNTLVTGTLEVDTVNNGVGDFLTRTAGGIVTRRTAAEVRSDIGAQAALTNPVTGTGTLNFVSKFTSTGSTLGNSQIFDNGTSVGIGTSGPLNKVDIVSSNNDSFGAITVRPSNQTQTLSLGWQGVSASLNFIVNAGASERMRITSVGNTGINTSIPETRLQIEDITKVLTNNVAGVAQGTLSLVSTDAQAANIGASLVFGGNYIDSNSTRIAYAAITGRKSNGTTSNADGYLSFLTWRTTGLTEAMRITSAGNVGIGTNSAGTRLYVDYTTNGSDGIVSRNLSSGTSAFGYVGAFNNLTNGIDLRSYSSTHASLPSTSVIQSSSGQTGGTLITQSGINPIRFNTNGGERMRISGGGEVGIGTTAPSFPLSFGTGLGNKIALYDASSGTGYGFGVQASLLQMFSNAVGDDITFGYGNSASMVRNVTFKGTGNVGIGTTAPVDKLDVNGSIRFRLNTPNFTGAIDSGVLDFVPTSIFPTDPQIRLAAIGTATVGSSICFLTGLSTTVAERMRITTAGNVGIGISNPVAKLDVFSSGTVQTAVLGRGLDGNFRLVTAQDVSTNADQSVIGLIGLDYITTPNAAVRFHRGGSTTGGFISFTTNDGSERMRITSAGAMGLGVTPTNTAGRFEASNDIVAYSSSDRRWKTNIKNIDSPLEKISQINGVEFDWIEDEPVHGNKGHDIGVIAQEIENILPDAVQTRESGMKAVKYEKVIPLLIEAIKEQQKQIEELKQLLNGITN
jgi:hypothetical protein